MIKETESALIKIKPYENEIQKNTENLIDDSKPLFTVDSHNPHFATLDYILTNVDSGFSHNKIKLLRIKGNDINNLSDYHESLKNYLEEVSQIKKNSLKVIKHFLSLSFGYKRFRTFLYSSRSMTSVQMIWLSFPNLTQPNSTLLYRTQAISIPKIFSFLMLLRFIGGDPLSEVTKANTI